MKKIILFTAFLLSGMLWVAKAQEYWIEGYYQRHGEGKYTLEDVRTSGIKLDGRNSLAEPLDGSKVFIQCDGLDATMVKFSFEMATTDCPNKWEKGFYFQYWDEDNNKWKTDVEACKGETGGYTQKDMVIMLVLDYSSSMKNNIVQLQSSATNFINAVSNASNGNIHIGIIAFSGMDLAQNQYFPITPVTSSNKEQFIKFIRNSSKGKETALYYSMDKAIGMMEDYVNSKAFSIGNYKGACMITFTDGLDNASINDKISVTMHRGRKNEYLSYLSGKLRGSSRKTILGQPVENFAIGFTGSEEFTSEDIAFFRDVLQQTTPDADHFKLASHFEEVEAYFEYIIKNLIQRWETLNMYIGESQHGRIRWVLNCGETPKRIPWIGVSAEVGDYNDLLDIYGGGNVDIAYPINEKLALGCRIGLFLCHFDCYHYYSEKVGLLIGPDVKITFPLENALILGLGGGVMLSPYSDFSFYLRAGYKFKSPWYITAEFLEDDNSAFGLGFGIGYSFGGNSRRKQP